MSGNFLYLKVEVLGSMIAIRTFKEKYLSTGTFDLNSVVPMPADLDFELNNLVETGYDALFGDWEKVSNYWMFKAPAEKLGYPFPLRSREELVACLKLFECADSYIDPAFRFKENLEKYGHGARDSWRKANWGTNDNVEGVRIISDESEGVIMSMVVNSYPRTALKTLSRLQPELEIRVSYHDDYKRNGMTYLLKAGKEVAKKKLTADEIQGLQ